MIIEDRSDCIMNIREVQYYVKKGIMWLADEVEVYLLTSGRSSNNPLVMQAGVVISQKTNQIRDALYNRSDLEYLDKKIKEECNHRIKRKEYRMMSDVEREKVDASWRQNRWKEAGLDGMRKRLGIDAVIDKNEVEEKFVMQKKRVSTNVKTVQDNENLLQRDSR